jgi:hypothetical protein
MSVLRVSSIQHPSAESPAIELDPVDGVVFSAASFDASAITSGTLDAARVPAGVGGLVAVKHVLKTDVFFASVAEGASVAVTGLSITHEVADPSNRLIIMAQFGQATNSVPSGQVGLAINDGTGFIAIGGAAGLRTSVTTGGPGPVSSYPTAIFVHEPGSGSKTYTVHAVNVRDGTRTLTINRDNNDIDVLTSTRTVSSLVIQEVKV